jgi:hypothetical protein
MRRELLRHLGLLFAAVCATLPGCSTTNIAGGGSDMPNGYTVAGLIYNHDSLPAANAEVTLTKVVVTSAGDSVVDQWIDTADADGRYRLEDVTTGSHMLRAISHDGATIALDQAVVVDSQSERSDRDLVLESRVDVQGHLILPDGLASYGSVKVFVPGMGVWVCPDDSGNYRLSRMPRGSYDIAFALDRSVNFTRVRIDTGALSRVNLWDVEFAVIGAMANTEFTDFDHTFERAYYVSPRQYRLGQEPQRLDSADLEHVDYFRYDTTSGAMIEWRKDGPGPMDEYDISVAGLLFAAGGDTARLVNPMRGDTLLLLGEILSRFPRQGEMVVAGLRMRQGNPGRIPLFDVIFMELRPELPPGEEGQTGLMVKP